VLSVVAVAFETAGSQVIGTATSGQAARTLGKEGEVSEARTLASLLWRLDHDRLALDDRSVVILDEAGMTEDAHLVALTARSKPPAPNWSWSETTTSSGRSAPAAPWLPWCAATLTPSTNSPRTAANTIRPNGTPWPSCATVRRPQR
jgi:hypothetical protein